MTKEQVKLDFVPDKRILRAISLTGSPFKDSFSELIDNSLDSFKASENKLENDYVTVSIQFRTPGQEGIFLYKNKEGEDYDIEIWDDAGGMMEEEFKKCLKLAYVDEKKIHEGSIRRYGVGLKTSLLSLGKRFKIMSRPVGSDKIFSLVYDDDKFVNNKDMNWDSLFFSIEDDDPNFPKHGTVLKIKKRDDLKIYASKISQMRSYFKVQYGRFLQDNDSSKKEIHITINRDEVIAEPLRLIKFKENKKHHFSFKLSSGKEVKGWYGFYGKGEKHGQVKGSSGFDLIWQRRIIERYSRDIGLRVHPEYQRIYGEIHLDGLEVDFHKTNFVKDKIDYVDFVQNMEYMLKGTDYNEAVEYFNSKDENTKTLAQLDEDTKQFRALFDFLSYIKRSRDLRKNIDRVIYDLDENDILPIPLEKLKDLENRLFYESVPLDSIPDQEKIIENLEADLKKQRELRKQSEEKEKNEKEGEKSSAGEKSDKQAGTGEKDDDSKGADIFFKFGAEEDFDIKIYIDDKKNIVKIVDRNGNESKTFDEFLKNSH